MPNSGRSPEARKKYVDGRLCMTNSFKSKEWAFSAAGVGKPVVVLKRRI
jgi:hypothetical protein